MEINSNKGGVYLKTSLTDNGKTLVLSCDDIQFLDDLYDLIVSYFEDYCNDFE